MGGRDICAGGVEHLYRIIVCEKGFGTRLFSKLGNRVTSAGAVNPACTNVHRHAFMHISPDPPADAVACLKNGHAVACLGQLSGCRQTRHPCTYHNNAGLSGYRRLRNHITTRQHCTCGRAHRRTHEQTPP